MIVWDLGSYFALRYHPSIQNTWLWLLRLDVEGGINHKSGSQGRNWSYRFLRGALICKLGSRWNCRYHRTQVDLTCGAVVSNTARRLCDQTRLFASSYVENACSFLFYIYTHMVRKWSITPFKTVYNSITINKVVRQFHQLLSSETDTWLESEFYWI